MFLHRAMPGRTDVEFALGVLGVAGAGHGLDCICAPCEFGVRQTREFSVIEGVWLLVGP
jgi:hypothetical protein